jgi:hypothetical protein
MACSISCSISAVFIIGMIYFYNSTSKSQIALKYRNSLPKNLKERYDKIVKERQMISYKGYILGFILSLFIIFWNLKIKKERMGNGSIVCVVLATSFLTNYFFYMISPKSDWMLNHITDKKESQAWLEMYRAFSLNYHVGLVLGIIGVGIFAFAFRC